MGWSLVRNQRACSQLASCKEAPRQAWAQGTGRARGSPRRRCRGGRTPWWWC